MVLQLLCNASNHCLLFLQPELLYNLALCKYKLKQYGPALKYLAEIVEKGVREHPELSVGR
jgi:tetratricopeptide repeat protein 30